MHSSFSSTNIPRSSNYNVSILSYQTQFPTFHLDDRKDIHSSTLLREYRTKTLTEPHIHVYIAHKCHILTRSHINGQWGMPSFNYPSSQLPNQLNRKESESLKLGNHSYPNSNLLETHLHLYIPYKSQILNQSHINGGQIHSSALLHLFASIEPTHQLNCEESESLKYRNHSSYQIATSLNRTTMLVHIRIPKTWHIHLSTNLPTYRTNISTQLRKF